LWLGGQMLDIKRRSNAMGEMALIAVLLSLFAGMAAFLNCFGRTDKPDPKVELLISLLRNVRHRLQARRDNSAIGSLLGLGRTAVGIFANSVLFHPVFQRPPANVEKTSGLRLIPVEPLERSFHDPYIERCCSSCVVLQLLSEQSN